MNQKIYNLITKEIEKMRENYCIYFSMVQSDRHAVSFALFTSAKVQVTMLAIVLKTFTRKLRSNGACFTKFC